MADVQQPLTRARWIALSTAAALSALCFALEARVGFNIWDEGFLWYGFRQVMAGAVPIRDFMSYDVGRYYMAVPVMAVLRDDGVLAMRTCLGLVQVGGVVLATYLVLADATRFRLIYSLLAAVVFVCWIMVMPYKNFDTAASIMLIAGLAFALSEPNAFRWFIGGVILGIAAMLGRNHGVYGAAAGAGAVVYAYWGTNWYKAWRAAAWFYFGTMIGYLPNIIMFVVVPGFASAFWQSIVLMFRSGDNLPLPIPWPWTAFGAGWVSATETLRTFFVGLFFIAMPAFGVGGLIYAAYRRRNLPPRELAVFVAAALLAIPYTHYAYSRADVAHLSFGIFPLLIGLLALPNLRVHAGFVTVALLLGASAFVTAPNHPKYQAALMGNWREVPVDGAVLKLAPASADEIELLERLASRYACNGRSFIATPYWPGSYAVLHRKAPIWEIYALFPRSVEFQEQEIARIRAADPGFAVIVDLPLDGREELRYMNTHPLIERFVRDNFVPVKDTAVPPYLQIYARAGAAEMCR